MAELNERWKKIDILLKPAGSVVAGVLVVGLGFFGSRYLEEQQRIEESSRNFAELTSKRQETVSQLRARLLGSIIDRFLEDDGDAVKDLKKDVLSLEILAQNFHDVLALGPLFKSVQFDIREAIFMLDPEIIDFAQKRFEFTKYHSRLERVARDISYKQIAALEGFENLRSARVHFDDLDQGIVEIIARERIGDHHFQLEILDVYEAERELEVKLTIWSPIYDDEGNATRWDVPIGPTFRLGFFDFPFIENIRLSGGYRSAVVLKNFENGSAEIAFVYFPGSRASLVENNYYNESLNKTSGE